MTRLRQEAGGSARALGLTNGWRDPWENELLGELEDEDLASESSLGIPTGALSGLPHNLAESILSFLAAGFSPNTTLLLKQKLDTFINTVTGEHLQKFRVAIPQSVEGFAVPGEFSRSFHGFVLLS